MVDAALVYVVGVLVLFFFWIYGVVAFLRDAKNWLVPAYRQWREEGARTRPETETGASDSPSEMAPGSRNVDE